MRREVARVYIGSSRPVDMMLVALLARGHVLLEGVPGVAKTTLVKAFAAALGVHARGASSSRPTCCPPTSPARTCSRRATGRSRSAPGPIFANVVLADEINRAPAKTQSALLEAMQERQVTIEGDRFELPTPFLVLATQNPIDLEGTYPLPEAQIDRFLVRVSMGYPTPRDEAQMLRTHGVDPPVARPVLDGARRRAAPGDRRARARRGRPLRLRRRRSRRFTRSHPRVALGASPARDARPRAGGEGVGAHRRAPLRRAGRRARGRAEPCSRTASCSSADAEADAEGARARGRRGARRRSATAARIRAV